MHRLASYQILRRFRIVSLLLLLMFLTLPVAAGFLGYGVFSKDIGLMRMAGMIFGFGVFLKMLIYVMSARLKCPLCLGAPFRNLGCTRHRTAEKLLGSYQAEVAVAVLFKDKFRCPYCGERTVMQVRERRRPAG
jgi:hypothetical protein